MKLYHNGEPEGWQIPGKQDRDAERVDVPSSPADLAAWLNARQVTATADFYVRQERAAQISIDRAADERHSEDPLGLELEHQAPAIARPPNCRELEEFVLDRATVAEVERIFAAIGARFAELRKEAHQ